VEEKDETIYQIALTLVPGVGDQLGRNLISYCGSASAVFRQKKHRLQRTPGIGSKIAASISSFRDFARAEAELEFIKKHRIRMLHFTDPAYPRRLNHVDDAPMILYYRGNADLENPKTIGIVGTRKCSEYGRQFIEKLLDDLAVTGALIISGLAYGIDIHAHRTALSQGLPTLGVVAHGLDRVYPSQHQQIARKMIEQGGLITEFPSRTNPDRENFPRRNRIVAGLCDVLVVVETAIRGGAMITAELANSYNRDVMALPGRYSDVASGGCNQLIQSNKAAMITCSRDLMELMNWDLEAKHRTTTAQVPLLLDLPEEHKGILGFLQGKSNVGIDELSFSLGIEPGILALRLLDLEFAGQVRSLPGRYFELNRL
jgi:DNA processing protein